MNPFIILQCLSLSLIIFLTSIYFDWYYCRNFCFILVSVCLVYNFLIFLILTDIYLYRGVGKNRFTVVSVQNKVYSYNIIYLLIIVLFIIINLHLLIYLMDFYRQHIVGSWFKKIFFKFIFRERRRERNISVQESQSVAPQMPPTGDLAHYPDMCSNWELNRWPFNSWACPQSTETHQPELVPDV